MAATKPAVGAAADTPPPESSPLASVAVAPAETEADPQEESEVVAVGTTAHVVRRAFRQFYSETDAHQSQEPSAPGPTTEGSDVQAERTESEPSPCESARSPVVDANPFVLLGESRKQLIRDSVMATHATATKLLAFLDERHRRAAAKDESIALDLARQGLVIGAQIPMGPSNLQLQPHELDQFGAFSDMLIHAKELVRNYHREREDRSGNGPSFLARKVSGIVREPPGYLSTTSAYDTRKETTLSVHQQHIAMAKISIDKSLSDNSRATIESNGSSESSTESVRLSGADLMPAHERRKNMAILERMQTKLDFLRNPRYTTSPQVDRKEAKTVEPNFVAEPFPVEFTEYDSGGIYEQTLFIRNTSHLSRRVRVLPPATIFFSVAEISFPDASGLIAPGMNVQVRLRFAPDSRADYKDAVVVQYESENNPQPAQFSVPVLAHRRPPELSIPLLLRAQHTLVGTRSVTTIPCKNTGGKARFWLMTEQDWARCEATSKVQAGMISSVVSNCLSQGGLRVGPFTLSPNEMELATGESVALQIAFLPSGVGETREKFVMVCDNCLVRVFQLVGRGCQVDVSISSVNEQPIDTSIERMGRVSQLVFARELYLNATASQTFTVLNETPIDLQFTWTLIAIGPRDASVHCPFTVTPASGVLQQSNSAPFKVTFCPHSARKFSLWQLVLYINNVPPCSMPGTQQLQLLRETLQRLHDEQARQHLGARLEMLAASEPAVESMRLSLHGIGRLGSFRLEPMAVILGDEGLVMNQVYTASTRVWNDCDAHVRVHWDLARATLLPPSFRDVEPKQSYFDIKLSATELDLGPCKCCEVEISIILRAVGTFVIAVPCAIVDPHSDMAVERWLRIQGHVSAPQLCILSPEVDFGLVLVSASAEATIAIRNDSGVASGDWSLAHLEASPTAVDPNTSLDASSARTLQRSGSKDSICSRTSAASSNFGGQQSNRSSTGSLGLFTTRDLAPRATVAFHPPVGRLGPGETAEVRLTCQSGSLPERFRGTIVLTPLASSLPPVFPGQPQAKHLSQCVSVRAEIQSPNVFLTPLRITLGTTFLGVPVERVVELINVSNLEADFKFMEPNGASKAGTIEFNPKQGVLRSKETLNVRVVYTARQAGKTTTLVACSVKGLAGPLGFEITANHKGLVLTYDVLTPTDAIPLPPKEVARSRGIAVADGDFEPDGNPHNLPKLHFGEEIPLTERRSLRLVIRNFSGINAQLELEPKRFVAASFSAGGSTTIHAKQLLSSTLADSLMSRSPRLTGKARKKLLLSDARDPSNRFQSEPGRAYIREQNRIEQDREILRDGRGIAFVISADTNGPLIEARNVSIPAWEQVIIAVTCVNNMPGTFSDVLSCRALGLPPVMLPMQATVVGTPLVLDPNCVGLHARRATDTPPTFSFGHLCVRSAAVTKTLRVVNRSPRPARLKWKLVEPGRENQRVQVSLRVDFAARVRLHIVPIADKGDTEFSFEVTPPQMLVGAFATASVQLTFFPTREPSSTRVLLFADAHWIENAPQSPLDGQDPTAPTDLSDPRCEIQLLKSPRLTTAAGKAIQAVRVANSLTRSPPLAQSGPAICGVSVKCIRVLLSADVVEPELFLDQTKHTPDARPYHVKFSTWSTLVDGDANTWNHAFHRREFSLINHLNVRLTFRLETTGPFALSRAESLAPKHPLATADLPPAHRRADGESFLFTLPPQMSVRVELRLDAAKLALCSNKPGNATSGPRDQNRLLQRAEGELLVRFTNQSIQTIRLVAEILHPLLVASPSVHNFGRVHLSRSRSVVLRVANPTAVPASFVVRHVPRPTPLSRAQKQEMATHHAHFTDDPDVFTFSQTQGVVRGPTISLRSAGGGPQPATNSCKDLDNETTRLVLVPHEICVHFQPREIARRYRSRFRLCVASGVDVDVVLEGQGHLDEVEYFDQDRPMVRASELTHRNLIYKKLVPPSVQR